MHLDSKQIRYFSMFIHKTLSRACHDCSLHTERYSAAGALGHAPAASWETSSVQKQLTCCNLHAAFCFCLRSFCKTQPSLHCLGNAAFLRERPRCFTLIYYNVILKHQSVPRETFKGIFILNNNSSSLLHRLNPVKCEREKKIKGTLK